MITQSSSVLPFFARLSSDRQELVLNRGRGSGGGAWGATRLLLPADGAMSELRWACAAGRERCSTPAAGRWCGLCWEQGPYMQRELDTAVAS